MDASTNYLARRRPLLQSGDVQVKFMKHAVRWVRARVELRGHVLLLGDVAYEIIDVRSISKKKMNRQSEFTVMAKTFKKNARPIRIRTPFAASWVQQLKAAAAVNRVASTWSVSNFSSIVPIGHGGGGNVYLVTHNSRHNALKVISKTHVFASESTLRHTLSERLSLEILRDAPYIVRLEHAFQDARSFYLLTEFCSGGDLGGLLKRSPGHRLSEGAALPLFSQIIAAVSAAHAQNIMIRDIKPENVLLTADGDVRLCDFGLSKVLPERFGRTKSFCGTKQYMSPEVVSRTRPYGISVDLWGLGGLFYTVLTGTTPFEDVSVKGSNETHEIHRRIRTAEVEIPTWLSQGAQDLLERLLRKDEKERWNLSDVMECSYFAGVNWNELENQDHHQQLTTTDGEEELTANFDRTNLRQVPALLLGRDQIITNSKYSNNVVGFAFNTAESVTLSSSDVSDGSLEKNTYIDDAPSWRSFASFRRHRPRVILS